MVPQPSLSKGRCSQRHVSSLYDFIQIMVGLSQVQSSIRQLDPILYSPSNGENEIMLHYIPMIRSCSHSDHSSYFPPRHRATPNTCVFYVGSPLSDTAISNANQILSIYGLPVSPLLHSILSRCLPLELLCL